jgi:arylsulfatase A-like enzyme
LRQSTGSWFQCNGAPSAALIAALGLSLVETIVAVSRPDATVYFTPFRHTLYALLSMLLHLGFLLGGCGAIRCLLKDTERAYYGAVALYAGAVLFVLVRKAFHVRGAVDSMGVVLAALSALGLVVTAAWLSKRWAFFLPWAGWAWGAGACGVWLSLLHRSNDAPASRVSLLWAAGLAGGLIVLLVLLSTIAPRRLRLLTAVALAMALWLVPFLMHRPEALPGVFPSGSASASRPNVVLIVVDTLRADAVSAFGGSQPTPTLDALASEGVAFIRAYSPAPYTLAAVTSVFSGLYPSAVALNEAFTTFAVPESVETFAEKLRAQGYRTGAGVANSVLGPSSGVHQGFEEFRVLEPTYQETFINQMPFWGTVGYRLGLRLGWWKESRDTTRLVLSDALRFLDAERESPFFLWLHFFDPHEPYNPPARFRKASLSSCPRAFYIDTPTGVAALPSQFSPQDVACARALYDGEVRYVDETIGALMSGLRARGLYDDTLIAVLSDHGEEFYEHGRMLHGFTLYDEQLHVPFLLKGPKLAPARISVPVTTLDLFPTLEELLGLALEDGVVPTAGHSLLPLMEHGTAPSETRDVYSETTYKDQSWASLRGTVKMIVSKDLDRQEVYDLKTDPRESHPIRLDAALEGDMRTQAEQIQRAGTEIRSARQHKDPLASKELLERLKALGYLR